MKPVTVTFAPDYYANRLGIRLGRADWEDPIRRTESDREIRRMLFDRFGTLGVGEKDPPPRPNVEAYGHRFMPALLGCEIVYNANQAPAAVKLDDACTRLEKFELPDLAKSDVMRKQASDAKLLKAKYGRVYGGVNTGSALNIAVTAFGEDFLVACAEEPELATDVLIKLNRLCLMIYEQVSNMNEPDVYPLPAREIGYGNCPAVMVSPGMYRRVVLPADLWLRNRVNRFHLHHCGVFDEYIDLYRELRPASLDIGSGSDYARIRAAFPDTPFSLIVNSPDVETAKPAEIHARISRMANAAEPAALLTNIWVSELGGMAEDEVIYALATAHEHIGTGDEGVVGP